MVQGLSRKKENKTPTSAVLISALQIIYFLMYQTVQGIK